MPYPNSNNPQEYGWGAPGAGNFVDFSYQGLIFPSGVEASTVGLITEALNLLVPLMPGGLFAPDGSRQLTKGNVDEWGQWGQETRQSRNSGAWSIHSWGLAYDINSGQNPNRSAQPDPSPYRLPTNTGDLLDQHFGPGTWRWGGDWGDWMHIELHMTPAEVAAWNTAHPNVIEGPPVNGIDAPVQPQRPTDPPNDPPTPAPTKDGFDMASLDDLKKVMLDPAVVDAHSDAAAIKVLRLLGQAAGFQVTQANGQKAIDFMNGLRDEANAADHGQDITANMGPDGRQ